LGSNEVFADQGFRNENRYVAMDIKKILFPTDFSTCSDAGLEQATALARDARAELLIVHVEEPRAAYGGGEMYYGISEPDQLGLLEMLRGVRPTDPTVAYEHRLLRGDPAERIVDLADAEPCDLIVMGTHGRTGFRRMLMGSVAEAVVRRANCPVFTYKLPHGAPKPVAAVH
jgi:nucleotide-binding universal stress UspA family protein